MLIYIVKPQCRDVAMVHTQRNQSPSSQRTHRIEMALVMTDAMQQKGTSLIACLLAFWIGADAGGKNYWQFLFVFVNNVILWKILKNMNLQELLLRMALSVFSQNRN